MRYNYEPDSLRTTRLKAAFGAFIDFITAATIVLTAFMLSLAL